MQSLLQCRAKSCLRLTTAKFYSPHGHNYSKVGVEPDIPYRDLVFTLLDNGYDGWLASEFQPYFVAAMSLSLVGLATPWIGMFGAACALFGLLAWEHAHVQAGQSVPLA